MKQLTKLSVQSACLTLVLGLGVLGAGIAQAQSGLDGVQVQGDFDSATTKYTGTIDLIHSDGRGIIVDDTLYDLDSIILVNGQNWSRERLSGELSEGMQITYKLKQGPSGPLPIISSIRVRR